MILKFRVASWGEAFLQKQAEDGERLGIGKGKGQIIKIEGIKKEMLVRHRH